MPGGEETSTIPTSPSSERPRSFFARNSVSNEHNAGDEEEVDGSEEEKGRPTKWSMGVLNDRSTNEVPGMPIDLGNEGFLTGTDHAAMQVLSFS